MTTRFLRETSHYALKDHFFLLSVCLFSALPTLAQLSVGDSTSLKSPHKIQITQEPVQKIPDFREAFPEPEHPTEPAKPQSTEQAQPKKESTEIPDNSPNKGTTDGSPELEEAWKQCHKRIDKFVFQRFIRIANSAFSHSTCTAVATYTVTRNGQILNPLLTQPCPNPIYNAIVLTAINSMNGDLQILQFPAGSRKTTIDKETTFTRNTIQDNSPTVASVYVGPLGPLRAERLALLKRIQEAKEKGMGIQNYILAFQYLESMVGKGAPQEKIQARLDSTNASINEQLSAIDRMKLQNLSSAHPDIVHDYLMRK